MFSRHNIVPVIMFHSVGLNNTNWIFSHISEPLELFEKKIEALRRAGYNFIFWDQLYEHMAGIKKVPCKSIMLTFDDGYLDNWVYVFPILKKYDAKATIFVNPDFVDPGTGLRPTFEDVITGRIPDNHLKRIGFLRWDEMKKMQMSGLVDIQSHSLTHTWYYCSTKLLDFHHPKQKKYPWMAWNLHKDRKPFYMVEDQKELVPFGMPVYEHEKALICKRLSPPTKLINKLLKEVDQLGGRDFFSQVGWREELLKLHTSLFKSHEAHFYVENDIEYKQRIYNELIESRKIISDKLDKPVNFICWPGGGYNNLVLKLAKEAGYKAWTLSSRDQSKFRNLPGANPQQIKRMSSFKAYHYKGEQFGFAGSRYFLSNIERHKGSTIHKFLGRCLLLLAILSDRIYR